MKERHVPLEYVAEISLYHLQHQHIHHYYCVPFVRALANLIVLVKTSALSEVLS